MRVTNKVAHVQTGLNCVDAVVADRFENVKRADQRQSESMRRVWDWCVKRWVCPKNVEFIRRR